MTTLIQFALGTLVGFLIFNFIYASMTESKKAKVRGASFMFELVFFFAPFGLSFISSTASAVVLSLGVGIGLSLGSLIVRTINGKPKPPPPPLSDFEKFCDSMTLEELRQYRKNRGWE